MSTDPQHATGRPSKPYTPTREQQAEARARRARSTATAASSENETYERIFGPAAPADKRAGTSRATREPAPRTPDDADHAELSEAAYRAIFNG